MNLLGFYSLPSSGGINALEFIEVNIRGFCKDLVPDVQMSFDKVSKALYENCVLDPNMPVTYVPQKSVFLMNDDDFAALCSQIAAMPIPEIDVHAVLGSQMNEHITLVSMLWGIILRNVRVCFLYHRLPQAKWVPLSALDDFRKFPGIEEATDLIVKLGLVEPWDDVIRFREADVYVITMIVNSYIAKCVSGNHENLDYESMKRVLQLTCDTYTSDETNILREILSN